MSVTSASVVATKFLFGMRDCTVDSDVSTGDFSLVLGILHVCGHVHERLHVSPGMNWCTKNRMLLSNNLKVYEVIMNY